MKEFLMKNLCRQASAVAALTLSCLEPSSDNKAARRVYVTS